ncbi:hypothetical protein KVT40_002136 [Elsinoe batatas]|uniref:Uncharacterized protein n=1 Tax=Elsinoe batatas TaxID=2601811 RepID=A0A8K0L7A1_9PEZI|nr:hypothetical protein KVT40_002136 [Elsinoe batatas]
MADDWHNLQADDLDNTLDTFTSLISIPQSVLCGYGSREGDNTFGVIQDSETIRVVAPDTEPASQYTDNDADPTNTAQTASAEDTDMAQNAADTAPTEHHNLPLEYRTSIWELSSKHADTLLRIVQSIGSTSTALSLRFIVNNFRNFTGLDKDSARRIGIARTSTERLAAIDDLTACMAHFSLARRMHIYMLFKEAVASESLRDGFPDAQDPFIVESGTPSILPRGNPTYRQSATIAQSMMLPGRSLAGAKRLRRVGQRLDMLVQRFDPGVLALLDENLSHEAILKVPDQIFDEFLTIIDHFEGDRIRLISKLAYPVVNMLLQDDDDSIFIPTLRLERLPDYITSDEVPRCSLAFAKLLLPQTELSAHDNTQDDTPMGW